MSCWFCKSDRRHLTGEALADTASLAICRAALKAVMGNG